MNLDLPAHEITRIGRWAYVGLAFAWLGVAACTAGFSYLVWSSWNDSVGEGIFFGVLFGAIIIFSAASIYFGGRGVHRWRRSVRPAAKKKPPVREVAGRLQFQGIERSPSGMTARIGPPTLWLLRSPPGRPHPRHRPILRSLILTSTPWIRQPPNGDSSPIAQAHSAVARKLSPIWPRSSGRGRMLLQATGLPCAGMERTVAMAVVASWRTSPPGPNAPSPWRAQIRLSAEACLQR